MLSDFLVRFTHAEARLNRMTASRAHGDKRPIRRQQLGNECRRACGV